MQHYARRDRHLIHTTGPTHLPPEEYVAAINRALGVTGKLVPIGPALLTDGNGNEDAIDLDVLPE
jgi:hypothetical protein